MLTAFPCSSGQVCGSSDWIGTPINPVALEDACYEAGRMTWFNTSCCGKTEYLKRCHKCHVVERYVRKAEGDCEPPGIPVERSQGVWQLLWRRLQYWDRSGFSVSGEWMWLCVGHILCRTGSLDTLKVWKHVLVPANICLCGKKGSGRAY